MAVVPASPARGRWWRMSLVDERRAQMFPRLADAQIARIAAHGVRRPVRRGEILFEQGEVNRRFFVVLAGTVEVVEVHERGERQVVVPHAGGFTRATDM